MKIEDLIEEIGFALLANKVRSALTILGIVIGIGSVIVMVAIGQGSQSSIQSRIESLGSNLIVVTPGAQRGVGMWVSGGRGSAQTLTLDDAYAIKNEIPIAVAVEPEISSRKQVLAKGTNTNVQVVGTVPDYLSVRNLEIGEGAFLSEQDIKNKSKVAILGATVKDDLFGEDAEALGKKIRINGLEFTVIGVSLPKGGEAMNSQDNMVFLPITTYQQYLSGSKYVSSIYVSAASQKVMGDLQNQITTLLLERHNISDVSKADFSTTNQADIAETASSVANTFTILLASVASISLLVGGIGIMNMMLTTVTERTREIGLRKAIGARKKDINLQFLGEAVALTFLGGLIGIILGYLVAWGVNYFGFTTTKISLWSIFLAFGVAALIGITFGYYPAQRASKLNPIEALRYE
ncbi:MAG TPA: ABC transporter permease [Candidatus Pacearchaeota archaeon]|nr:ABC transporter permease [Candidatus Pacearchaeota archaeon]